LSSQPTWSGVVLSVVAFPRRRSSMSASRCFFPIGVCPNPPRSDACMKWCGLRSHHPRCHAHLVCLLAMTARVASIDVVFDVSAGWRGVVVWDGHRIGI
jgi:hypothetical protein